MKYHHSRAFPVLSELELHSFLQSRDGLELLANCRSQMALPTMMRIIPTIARRLSEGVKLVRSSIRDRVLRLQSCPIWRLGERFALLAKPEADEPLDVRGDATINSTMMIRGNKDISFSTSFNNFSHFLFSWEPAFYVHSDFDNSSLPFQVHSSRYVNSSWITPSEDSPSESFSMNSSRMLQQIRVLKRDQHEYYQWYLREWKNSRQRLMYGHGIQSAGVEKLEQ